MGVRKNSGYSCNKGHLERFLTADRDRHLRFPDVSVMEPERK